jgi:hypothetical protein
MTEDERRQVLALQEELNTHADSRHKKRVVLTESTMEDIPRAAASMGISLDEMIDLLRSHYKKSIDEEMPDIH